MNFDLSLGEKNGSLCHRGSAQYVLAVGVAFRLTNQESTANDIVKSFFAIYGEEGNFTYREGWERIPDNWYKTPMDYSLLNLNMDTVDWIGKYPELGR